MGGEIPTTVEPGIPLCHPNYTKNRKFRDLLDTPDPKDEMPTVQIQSLGPLEARVQFYLLYRKIRMVQYDEKRVRHQGLSFCERYEGTGPYSKTKKL